MKHWWKIIIALMLVWSASVGAHRLQPLLPHYDGRTAIATVNALSTSVHWNRFVTNIASYQGWTVVEASTFLTNRAWVMCPFSGWFASDGVYYRQGSWHMGTIYRETVQGEQFACTTEGRPVFSTRCGNPVQPTSRIVETTRRCREYHYGGTAAFFPPVVITHGYGFDPGPTVSKWHGFGFDCISN